MDLKRAILLYKLISQNQRLQDRRHPMFEKNLAMKVFGYVFVAFWAVYLMVFGVAFYYMFEGAPIEAFDYVDGGLIFFLALDFFARFGMQETPAQNVKQYKLLNIPNNFLLNVFLGRMGLRLYNVFWFFFFVPFALLAIPQFYGLTGMIGYLLGIWLLYVMNSYWYLIWRTAINRRWFYLLIPIVIYAILIYFGIFDDDITRGLWGDKLVQPLFYGSLYLMRWFCQWNPLAILLAVAVIVPLFLINRKMQASAIYFELSKTDEVKKVKSRDFKFLDKFGEIGEYLKLEIKSVTRNAVVKKQFVSAFLCMIIFNSIFSFTDIYDSMFMRIYILVYCFCCLGTMMLTSVMCPEGNYIDGLMSRKESVLSLLKAKYFFNCMLTLIPLLFCILPIVKGKITIVDALGCLFFTTGCVFPFLFQLAVYNDNTINLNAKITKAGSNSKAQMLFSFAALFAPMIVMNILVKLFSQEVASVSMLVMGIVGTVLFPLWLRNVYNRFMKRRYQNLDGFRNSRG